MAKLTHSEVIDGVVLVDPVVHGDERGIFVETYRREWFPEGREMIQGNRGDRQAGAIVGLHYHLHQADYWYVPYGRARVVLHDLREGSPTDGATLGFDLGENLDGTHDQSLVLRPTPLLRSFASSPADERLVHLNLAMQRLAVGVQHRRAQLVEHLERRLVAADAELALQLDRGDPRSERGDQEGRVEPIQERLL